MPIHIRRGTWLTKGFRESCEGGQQAASRTIDDQVLSSIVYRLSSRKGWTPGMTVVSTSASDFETMVSLGQTKEVSTKDQLLELSALDPQEGKQRRYHP